MSLFTSWKQVEVFWKCGSVTLGLYLIETREE